MGKPCICPAVVTRWHAQTQALWVLFCTEATQCFQMQFYCAGRNAQFQTEHVVFPESTLGCQVLKDNVLPNKRDVPRGTRTGLPFTCRDITKSKQPNSNIPVYRPLLGLTVWITTVVHETRVISFWSSINYPVLQKGETKQGILLS